MNEMPEQAGPVRYDTLIAGGEVIDPGGGHSGRLDIAIAGGRIAEVAAAIPAASAARTVDAAGCVVTPGLVDLHTHVFWGGTFWGIDPASLAGRTGVTTWVDAGSAGAFTVAAFRRACVAESPVRVKALLNISAIGLAAETGELQRPELADPHFCAEAISEHKDLLAGVKCRMDRNTTGGQGVAPLAAALQAAENAGVPVMVHIGAGPPGIDEVLDLLRPGDIVTHCATGHSMALVDDSQRLRASARRALSRGVLLDVGHGYGGFSFPVAEALLREGAPPHVISSDAHQRSVRGAMRDLPTCLSKFWALGMPLPDVIRAATIRPAQALGLAGEAGSLGLGRPADIAVFAIEEGSFTLADVAGVTREAGRVLTSRLTLLGGEVVPPAPLGPPPAWIASEGLS